MNTLLTVHWVLAASIWYFANGVLHDIVILIRHKGDYNRDLLRLLMDGHLLIFFGLVLFVCYFMMLNKIYYGAIISLIVSISMLVYCGLIFPFLKSFVTIFISTVLAAVSLNAWLFADSAK
ncbi:MAG: hypothetical protein ABIP51_00190 [Bacteroidia bacterium]